MTTVQDLPGPHRPLAGRRAAVGADGPGLAPRGQPRRRQPRGRARARGHRDRAEPALLLPGRRVRDRRPGRGHDRRRARCQWEPLDVGAGSVLAIGTARARACGWRSRSAAASTCRPTSAAPRRSPSAASAATAAARWCPATCCGRARRTPRPRIRRSPRARCSPASVVRRRSSRRPHLTSHVADRRHRGPARGAGVLHPRRHRHALRDRLRGALQLRPHRRPPDGPATDVGAQRRRRGRPAPVQHPRHAVRGRRARLHRRHPDHPRPGRAVASADSSARRWSPAATCGSSASCAPATPCGSCPVREDDAAALDSAPRRRDRRPTRGGDGDDGVIAASSRQGRPTAGPP